MDNIFPNVEGPIDQISLFQGQVLPLEGEKEVQLEEEQEQEEQEGLEVQVELEGQGQVVLELVEGEVWEQE
jgi:hypothetical protein